ncbi:MAG: hypothetical protein ACYTEV_02195 [Planctomycetota bacterium]
MSPIEFERPEMLLTALLVLPTAWLALRARGGQSAARLVAATAIRCGLLVLLAMALAEPRHVHRRDELTVTMVVDRSLSVPGRLQRESLEFLRRAAEDPGRRPGDRTAVIAVAREAEINALASVVGDVDVSIDPADRTATNLAGGVRKALAIMPDDTANRIVVVSDGNETMDSVLQAAELARANGVPVDCVPLRYAADREVVFEELIAPARARRGQSVRLRSVLSSRGPATGTLRLRVNGVPLDLDPDAPGDGRRVVLEPGLTALEQVVPLDRSGPYRFEGVFEPDPEVGDGIDRNNASLAVTFVGGEGRVLFVDVTGRGEGRELAAALEEAGLEVDRRRPEDWIGGASFLGAYDCVVTVNLPIHALEPGQDRLLASYVHDLGGGLVMVGGDQSFGAGGWIDSATAETLPLDLNPRQTRQMLAGALAVIVHSCEMPQGNYWGQLVAESAINALSRLDYCGIVEYQWNAGPAALQGNGWAFPMQRLGDKTAALAATRQLQIGDMPSFDPSFRLAHQGLTSVPAAQRHAIVISDGDPSPPLPGTLASFVRDGVSCTTVMVGGHGTALDLQKMRTIAEQTGGQFYKVDDPKQLPQIFFKEATMVSRSLIQDGQRYAVAARPGTPGPITRFAAVPGLDGYVLTEPRPGLAQVPLVIPTEEGEDPLYAFWNHGLGRSVAYTSAVSGSWGGPWLDWSEFAGFWEQTVRWAMRPSDPADIELSTSLDGDLATVEMEATDADAGPMNFLRTDAVVVGPDGRAMPLAMSQVGPGRYRGSFRVDATGAYLVNVRHERPGTGDGPRIGTTQAAVVAPFSREFRLTASNDALLQALADRTGGRVIDPGSPAAADLFQRGDLEPARRPRPIWDLLAIIAAGLMFVDVATRRLSLDFSAVVARLQAMVGREATRSDASIEALRRARGAAGASGMVTGGGDADPGLAGRRFTAADAGETSRISPDAGPAASGEGGRGSAATDASAASGALDPEAEDTTARLLRARRQARAEGGSAGDANASPEPPKPADGEGRP